MPVTVKRAVNAELLKTFGDVKQTKNYFQITNTNKKKAIVWLKMVSLHDYKESYGTGDNVLVYTDEEIKKRHLGKVKCNVYYETDDQLKNILTKYFE